MIILNSHPLLRLLNSHVTYFPLPSNISYLWNFGILQKANNELKLAFCIVIQIITGGTKAMHYNALGAFNSAEHRIRDVNNG